MNEDYLVLVPEPSSRYIAHVILTTGSEVTLKIVYCSFFKTRTLIVDNNYCI